MFNGPYFKQLMKSNIKFMLLFTVVLCIFLTVMSSVFTEEAMGELNSAVQGTAAANILTGNGTLIGFMSNSFYALMAIVFPMVYAIFVGNRLIAEKVDRGSMAGLLSTPVTRLQVAGSGAIYLLFSLALMWLLTTGVGIAAAEHFQPGALDFDTFALMNVGAFLYHAAISSICFCASCVFNTSKHSLMVGAGVPLAFFVISLFVKLSEDLDILRYLTLNTLFDTESILEGTGYGVDFAILIGITVVLYTVGLVVFHKKDLPI